MIDLVTRVLERPLVVEDALAPADAIVVLGAPLARDGRLSRILEERVDAAVALYHAGAARLVVATGGITERAPRAEADAIAESLAAAGIPDVIVEREARSTAENAQLTARLLRPLGARTVWLVTQPFHGRRAALLFRRAGLTPRVWHIADSVEYRDRRRAMKWVAREYASWALLAVRTLASRRS